MVVVEMVLSIRRRRPDSLTEKPKWKISTADGRRSTLKNRTSGHASHPNPSVSIRVHPVRQAKPGFSIVLKREQHVK
jgi:hypothetical protein